ncbi:hypothetical protein EIP91_007823 [Steccherinum ochraceum]|uniref:BTB domain-containing protein n=1 Tax=Steccherinum ochraceum TaxID=92696 RepID=A0A4R0RHP8_9APHY|nr:hypothetical protein EIP91_007823 [Steccherinum ochraceum]
MVSTRGKKRKLDEEGTRADDTETETVAAKEEDEETEGPEQQALDFEHGDLWFEDGNVILTAEDVGFKVYRGILCKHSDVFSALLAQDEASAQSLTLDGCPVIALEDTSAELLCLLSALHDSASQYCSDDHVLTFQEVACMLRLGTKYKLEHIRKEAIRRLKQCFPSDLKDFITRDTSSKLKYTEAEDSSNYCARSSVRVSSKDRAYTIILARQFDLPDLLPAAFYSCAQLKFAFCMKLHWDATSNSGFKLSHSDANRLGKGSSHLKFAMSRSFRSILDGPQRGCLDRQSCQSNMNKNIRSLWDAQIHFMNVLMDADRMDFDEPVPRIGLTPRRELDSWLSEVLRGSIPHIHFSYHRILAGTLSPWKFCLRVVDTTASAGQKQKLVKIDSPSLAVKVDTANAVSKRKMAIAKVKCGTRGKQHGVQSLQGQLHSLAAVGSLTRPLRHASTGHKRRISQVDDAAEQPEQSSSERQVPMTGHDLEKGPGKDRDEVDRSTSLEGLGLKRGEIWFEDGNLILVTQKVAFKVFRGIISQHSEIFRDMFDMPQPARQDKVDGCLMVNLSDSPEDLVCLLSALHNSASRFFNDDHALQFDEVSAMLRLGSKYMIDHVREEAIRRLKQCFPNDLEDYVTPHTQSSLFYHDDKRDASDYCPQSSVYVKLRDCPRAVSLARAHDLGCVLPAAFYACVQLTHKALLRSQVLGSNTLSSDDLVRCLEGKKRLAQFNDSTWGLSWTGPADDCTQRSVCQRTMRKRLEIVWKRESSTYNALLDSGRLDYELKPQPCNACTEKLRTSFGERRRLAWTSLRSIFDLSAAPEAEEANSADEGQQQ